MTCTCGFFWLTKLIMHKNYRKQLNDSFCFFRLLSECCAPSKSKGRKIILKQILAVNIQGGDSGESPNHGTFVLEIETYHESCKWKNYDSHASGFHFFWVLQTLNHGESSKEHQIYRLFSDKEFIRKKGPCPPLCASHSPSSWSPGDEELLPNMYSHHDSSPSQTMEPDNHGTKPWAKINPSSFKSCVRYFVLTTQY